MQLSAQEQYLQSAQQEKDQAAQRAQALEKQLATETNKVEQLNGLYEEQKAKVKAKRKASNELDRFNRTSLTSSHLIIRNLFRSKTDKYQM